MTVPHADRERLLQAMDSVISIMEVGHVLALANPDASLEHITGSLECLGHALVAEGHPAVAVELYRLMLELAPPHIRAEFDIDELLARLTGAVSV
jgi:hypothetical protein